MKLILKSFPEITIKSRPVRRQFMRQLGKNIRTVLRDLDPNVKVIGEWDNLELFTALEDPAQLQELYARLRCTPGVHFSKCWNTLWVISMILPRAAKNIMLTC